MSTHAVPQLTTEFPYFDEDHDLIRQTVKRFCREEIAPYAADWDDEGIFPRGDAAAVALELWSAAHGVASLLIAKPHLPFGDAEAFTDRVLRAVFSGNMVTGLVGADATPQQVVERLTALKSSEQVSNGWSA